MRSVTAHSAAGCAVSAGMFRIARDNVRMGAVTGGLHEFCGLLYGADGKVRRTCVPGSSFGTLGEGYVRMALVLPPEKLKEAVESIRMSGILHRQEGTK